MAKMTGPEISATSRRLPIRGTTNSRKELQVDRAVHTDERRLQNRDLQQPGIALRGLHREAAVCDKGADHLLRQRCDQRRDVRSVVGV